jgi:hypothetical protein
MKATTYKGHTITTKADSHCALVFKGEGLTPEQLSGSELLVCMVSGDVKNVNGALTNNAIEKAKARIDTLK